MAMAASSEQELDSLSSLEERITRTVELVNSLRHERDELAQRVEGLEAERNAAQEDARASSGRADDLMRELEELRNERTQVRSRIEKLLGQMDVISA
jgi:FtsZ-binding cell division protein ZapB